jgi:hypothetical protein
MAADVAQYRPFAGWAAVAYLLLLHIRQGDGADGLRRHIALVDSARQPLSRFAPKAKQGERLCIDSSI